MRVSLWPPAELSRGIHRVAAALAETAPPELELVTDPDRADLEILHVIGIEALEARPRPYAAVMYNFRTTQAPTAAAWAPFWRQAAAVWSYYDLAGAMADEGLTLEGTTFYDAPLGVDGTVFKPAAPLRKRFVIGTSGYIADTESVGECYEAARAVDGRMFHLGPPLEALGPGVTLLMGVPDTLVAEYWAQCTYVAGLRRIEGFELPVLEALACGSRPVCFDRPHYRRWFGEHAEYIAEEDPAAVTESLAALFRGRVRPVTPAERQAVIDRFNWRDLAAGFWARVLG